jgi:NAD(P)H-flavin reductase
VPRATARTTIVRRSSGGPVPDEPASGPRGPASSPPGQADLLELREILPGQWQSTWHAPAIASAARAGQYVHLRTVEAGGLPVRRPLPVVATDPASGTIAVYGTLTGAAGIPGSLRVGDRGDLLGPFGRPFELDPRSRHLLLIAEGGSTALIRLLAAEAVRDGRSVVVLMGATGAAQVHPSSLLRDEVEYVVATSDGSLGHRGSVVDLVKDYEAWADQAFAAGPPALLAALAGLAEGRRARLGVASLGRKRGGGRPPPAGSPEARRRAWLQVILPHTIGCAAGTCLGCAVMGAAGVPLRVCREGPAFAAAELVLESSGAAGGLA